MGEYQLRHAILCGDLPEVVAIVSRERDLVDAQGPGGWTPLFYAARTGRAEMVKFLLDQGAYVDHSDAQGQTALYLASTFGMVQIVMLLLGHGAKPTAKTLQSRSPVTTACRSGHAPCLLLLLCYGGVDLVDLEEDGQTAITIACLRGRTEVVYLLLNVGADPTIVDPIGRLPVQLAMEGWHTGCVNLLEEWERAYLLSKAHHLRDAADLLSQFPSASTTTIDDQAKQKRMTASPAYLKDRVKGGWGLPVVRMGAAPVGIEGEVDRWEGPVHVHVVQHTLLELNGDLFGELMAIMPCD